jgi:hypothetical protein
MKKKKDLKKYAPLFYVSLKAIYMINAPSHEGFTAFFFTWKIGFIGELYF